MLLMKSFAIIERIYVSQHNISYLEKSVGNGFVIRIHRKQSKIQTNKMASYEKKDI